jgi:cystathionine beta-lyase/cystathionine gamma-synthase
VNQPAVPSVSVDMVTLLHDRGGRPSAAAGRASVDGSFDEVADDLDELVWLVEDIVERVRGRQRSLIRLHRTLEGDSIDDLERHMREVAFACDEIRRAARERSLDARDGLRSRESLEWLTRDRARLADRVRTVAGIAASTVVAAEWQSPSFDHSVRSNAGTFLGRVEAHRDDYRRDRHAEARAYEDAFLREYVAPPPDAALRALATSCGMAAVTTVLAFLGWLGALSGPVVVGMSAYHETRGLLRAAVPAERLHEVDESDTASLVRAIETASPTAIVLDTLANASRVAIPDIDAVAEAVARAAPHAILVLDNSGRSCTFRPFDLVRGRARTVVVESLTKYAQFGLDRVTGGIILASSDDAATLDDLREHLGTNIADASAATLPSPDGRRLGRRLGRIDRNTTLLARHFDRAIDSTAVRRVIGIEHASLRPDATSTRFGGGWFTLRFRADRDGPLDHRRFVEAAVEHARRARAPLVVGASFGLDVTRIYPISSSSGGVVPFVRISAGIEHRSGIERLAETLIAASRDV